jgi:DNA-binding NarL/FixJ family response regulator
MLMIRSRCLLIGDNATMIDGLRYLLEPNCEVLAVAGELHTALKAVGLFCPDMAIIHVELEGGGLEMSRHLREACPELAVTVLGTQNGASQPSIGSASGLKLRTQERQVVAMLNRGLSMKEVARELHITVRTVAYHKYKALERSGALSDLPRFFGPWLT